MIYSTHTCYEVSTCRLGLVQLVNDIPTCTIEVCTGSGQLVNVERVHEVCTGPAWVSWSVIDVHTIELKAYIWTNYSITMTLL